MLDLTKLYHQKERKNNYFAILGNAALLLAFL